MYKTLYTLQIKSKYEVKASKINFEATKYSLKMTAYF